MPLGRSSKRSEIQWAGARIPRQTKANIRILQGPPQANRGRSALDARQSRLGVCASLALIIAGCASTRPVAESALGPGQSRFRPVAILDYRNGKEPNLPEILRTGDLIVNYVSLGRSVTQREWLFAVLPYGHSMIVMDPNDQKTGLFECRFRGCRKVTLDDLRRYSFSIVYRLDDAERLNLDRLQEFATAAHERCTSYSFRSWLGINGNLMPESLDSLTTHYTCSTFAVAAYHYCGATLSVTEQPHHVITPLSLAASHVTWNANANPAAAVAKPANSSAPGGR